MSNIHRKCAKCGRTRAEDLTVTYHTFPDPGTTNLSKARAWATFCWPDGDWSSSDSLYTLHNQHKVLCGRHFNSTQFYDSGRQKLSKFAVPDAPEVQTLLNKENVFNVNIQQSIAIGLDRTSEVPFSQIENIMVQSNLAKVAVEEPGTSKSSGGVHNAPTQWQFPVDSGVPQSLAKRRSGILGAINASKISELSKREVILYNTCKKKIKEIARLRTKFKKKKVDIVQKVCKDENVKKLCNLNIKTAFAVLLQTQLKNAPKKPKGYTLNQKIMALVIYKKSPACYRLLKKMFTLPCQSSLNKLLNRVPLKPGINKHIFLSLKQMAEKQENDEDDSALLCNNFVSFLTAENMDTPNSGFVGLGDDDIEIAIADAIETIDQVTPESQACGYVCGFIFKKLKNNNCPECRNIYLAQNKEPIHIFTSLKEYDESSDSLNYASKTVIQCVEVMASIINNFLRKEAWMPHLKSNILNLLDNVEMDFFKDCPRHIEINKKYLKNSIFFIRIKRYTILKNRDIDEEQRNKTLERKMKILQNK